MNLKELSAVLGLSQTTVSRALNGYPEVSEDTRARVLTAAERHNYRPNARAKSLATGRAMTIGHILLPMSSRNEVMSPIFADFVAGAGEIYNASGYDMMLTLVDDDGQPDAFRSLARRGSVDGFIVHAPRSPEPRIPILQDLGLPFVVHGRSGEGDTDYSWIDTDNRRAFKRATEFLLDLGHRRIALANGPEELDFARRRRRGFEEAMAERGLTPDPMLITDELMTEAYGYRTAKSGLDLADPPTAYLASSLLVAMGIRRAIEDRGLKMGRDVSVVTHDDDLGYLRNGEDTPIFTASRSPVHEAGQKAARLILELIGAPDTGPQQVMLPATLLVGRSTGPAPTPAFQTAAP